MEAGGRQGFFRGILREGMCGYSEDFACFERIIG